MNRSRDFTTVGKVDYGWYGNYECGRVVEQVAIAGATATLKTKMPAFTRPICAQMANRTALTLSTATRVGLGTTADPDMYCLSGTGVAINTKHGPQVNNYGHGLHYANPVASAAVTNTVTETAFSFTGSTMPDIPANSLKPGDVLRYRFQGIATATNGTDTLAVKAYLGSVELSALAAVDVANNDIFQADLTVVVRAVGASGTIVVSSLQPVIGAGKQDGSSAITVRSEFKASQAIDTTAALTPSVKATWSVANAGNSCRLDVLTIEHLRPGSAAFSTADTDIVLSAVSDAGIQAGTATGTVDCEIIFVRVPQIPTMPT